MWRLLKKVHGTARITLFALVAALALSLSSCETLAAAFADQVGRNIADSLWDK